MGQELFPHNFSPTYSLQKCPTDARFIDQDILITNNGIGDTLKELLLKSGVETGGFALPDSIKIQLMKLQQHKHSRSAMTEQFISESACSEATSPVLTSVHKGVIRLRAVRQHLDTSCQPRSARPACFVSIKEELMC